jgi:geranylgeranyl diphosphate synthase, type II
MIQDTVTMDIIRQLQGQFLEFQQSQQHGAGAMALYQPIDYIMSIGGKRLRPTLLLLACKLYGPVDQAFDAAYAMELFHNFTLMHDDIMDDAAVRRGEPSAFAKYGTNQTILSGDVMLIESYKYLCKYNDPILQKQLLTIFNKMSIGVCEGQQMDMAFETRTNVEIPEYLKMIELKTAVLLAACLQMGVLIAGADAVDQEHIYQYGINAGIAFQIQDDILDTFGDEHFGKMIGGDILQNKKTYLYLKAMDLASTAQRQQLDEYYDETKVYDPKVKIAAVTSIFKSLVVQEYADQLKEAYLVLALSHLDALTTSSAHIQALKEFTNTLVARSV